MVGRKLEFFCELFVSDAVDQPPAQYLSVALGVFATDKLGDHPVGFGVSHA